MRVLLRAVIVGIVLTLSSAVHAQEFNWPDFQHVEYGWPLAWLTRTLSTIIGPTDQLSFNASSFLADLLLYSVLAFALLFAVQRSRRNK